MTLIDKLTEALREIAALKPEDMYMADDDDSMAAFIARAALAEAERAKGETGTLIARLWDEGCRLSRSSFDNGCAGCGVNANLADEAADTIERLERELAEAKAPHTNREIPCPTCGFHIRHTVRKPFVIEDTPDGRD